MVTNLRRLLAGALRKRRVRIVLALLLVLAVTRIALPYALRSLIVSQADAALVGRVSLEDLDLSLIRGGVTLHGLGVHTDELPSDGLPSTEPALFECKRLWTQIRWLALFAKTIEIEELELEGFAVRLDRTHDGLVLPRPVASEAPAPEAVLAGDDSLEGAAPGAAPAKDTPSQAEPAPAAPQSTGWSFAANDVALRDGAIHFRDHTVGESPKQFDVEITDLSAKQIALRIDPTGREPGRVAIVARVGDGSVGLDSRFAHTIAGVSASSTITIENLPIDDARVYLQRLGWSDLTGRLDATIEHRIEPEGAHEIGGSASLSGVAIRVPGLDRPALGFEKLAVVLDRVDVVSQSAAVAEVSLAGARLVVDARSKTPLPVIAALASGEGASVESRSAQAVPAPAEPGTVAGPATPAESAPSPRPWTWSVRTVRLDGAVVELEGEGEPLPVGVDAEVRSLSSAPASRWPLALQGTQGAGSLGLDGELAIDPLAFDGTLAIADLALPALLSRIDAPATGLLREGTLRAKLTLALAKDLRVGGTLALADLDLGEPETEKQFGVGWKDLEIEVREISVPDLLGTEIPAAPRTIGVKLDTIRLADPSLRVTRTADGIVLPSFGAEAPASEPPADEAGSAGALPANEETPEASSPAASDSLASPPTTIQVEVAQTRIDRARARIHDRTVQPFYSTRIDRLDLRARGIRWPDTRVADLALTMDGLGGAKLEVRGSIHPGASKLDAKLDELALAQFNPYVTPTGYGLSRGSLSFATRAAAEKDSYRTSTDVVVHELEVGGSQGEALFQQAFGIPLSVALGLLKDLDGKITLSVPVDADASGVKLGIGRIVAQALRKALMGALASPLKLLGAITSNGKVERLAPEPVAFVPGEAQLAPEGAERVEQIAGLLTGSPGIALTLAGVVSEGDLRVLRERALLVELEAASGIRALANLGEIGTRRAVRDHLAAKLAGAPPVALDAEPRDWLETHVAGQGIDAAELTSLASTRAEAVRESLVRDHAIAESRLAIAPSVVDPPADVPGVAIQLGAPTR
jgi:hypothetical protein